MFQIYSLVSEKPSLHRYSIVSYHFIVRASMRIIVLAPYTFVKCVCKRGVTYLPFSHYKHKIYTIQISEDFKSPI